jgi:hypothetical protein
MRLGSKKFSFSWSGPTFTTTQSRRRKTNQSSEVASSFQHSPHRAPSSVRCDDVQTETNLVREKRMIRSSSPSTNEVPADSGNAGGQGARGRGQLAGIGAEENGNEKYD